MTISARQFLRHVQQCGSSVLFVRAILLAPLLLTPLYRIRFRIFGVPTNGLEILALGAIATVVGVSVLRSRQWTLRHCMRAPAVRAIIVAVVAMVCGGVISTAVGGDWRSGLGILKGWFLVPFGFAAAILCALRWRLVTRDVLAWALALGGTLIAMIAIGFAIGGDLTYDHRLRAFYQSPNFLAMALVSSLPFLAVQYASARRGVWRSAIAAALLIVSSALFLTRSFGGLFAAISGGVVLAIMQRPSWQTGRRAVIGAVGIVVAALVVLWPTPRVQDFFIQPERSSLASRAMIWRAAWDIARDHPLAGIGPGRFQEVYLAYQSRYAPYLEWAVPQPHNLYLAFWLQTGALGVVGFIALLVIVASVLWKNRHVLTRDTITAAAAAALVSILAHGIVDTPYWKHDLALIFWVLVVLILYRGVTRRVRL